MWQKILAAMRSFIALNPYLVLGLALFVLSVGILAIPATRHLWFKGWGLATKTPVASGLNEELASRTCLSCHADKEKKMSQKTGHRPFLEKRCIACHTPHDPKTNVSKLQAKDQIDLCTKCHDVSKKMTAANTHPPFKKGWCTACHDPHASDNPSILRLSQSDMCIACHNMYARFGAMKVQHKPFARQACLGCHDPHGSPNPVHTRYPLPDLCFNCHPTAARDMEMAVLHPPFSQAWCTNCHNPHASNWPRMIKAPDDSRQPFVDVCISCHGSGPMGRVGKVDLHVSHPVGISVRDGHNVIDPYTGEQLTCISCHHPHGSNAPRMWRRDRDSLCLGCHRKLTGRFNMPW